MYFYFDVLWKMSTNTPWISVVGYLKKFLMLIIVGIWKDIKTLTNVLLAKIQTQIYNLLIRPMSTMRLGT